MKLWEALQTGKRFKLKHDDDWNRPDFDTSFTGKEMQSDDWIVEPDPKPRLLAWRYINKGSEFYGTILLAYERDVVPHHYERLPHLDQPEDKE